MKLLATVFLGISPASAENLTAVEIMARVARNQAVSVQCRKNYTYRQTEEIRLRYSSGKLAREEKREYVLTPIAARFVTARADHPGGPPELISIPVTPEWRAELTHFEGKYESKGQYLNYDQPGYKRNDKDIDSFMFDDSSKDSTNAERSLFPFVESELAHYTFRLEGTQTFEGRRVYRVAFEPKPQRGSGDADWQAQQRGEALIDVDELQPIVVRSQLVQRMPLFVRLILGSSAKSHGLTIKYQKLGDGVWLPASSSGEYDMRILFTHTRKLSVSSIYTDFRRTQSTSSAKSSGQDR
jgi:hypothetical protein